MLSLGEMARELGAKGINLAARASPGVFVEPHATGQYTLAAVQPDHDVFFFATGTGEAPHNAMIAELLAGGHRGQGTGRHVARRTGRHAGAAQAARFLPDAPHLPGNVHFERYW